MDEVVGFTSQKSFFATAIARGVLAHAYVFVGPTMIGKRTLALALAHQLNPQPVDFLTNVRTIAPDQAEEEIRSALNQFAISDRFWPCGRHHIRPSASS